MIRLLLVLGVIAVAIWGAIEAGVIRFADGDDQTATAERPEPVDPFERAFEEETLPQPMFASNDEDYLRPANREEERPVMQAQVVLDRLGFSPGVIDGKEGQSFEDAVRGFQRANELEETGTINDETRAALSEWKRIPSTRRIRLTQEFIDSEIVENIPEEPEDRAQLEWLGYESLEEKLAERFHTTPAVLRELNDGELTFEVGARIRVPNIGNDRITGNRDDDQGWLETLAMLGVANDQPQAARIVVDKSDGVLMVFDEADKLIAQFPATMGSEHDPLPLGEWDILGVAHNPNFQYNPDLFWDVEDSEESLSMPPGPNSSVGVVWIDLSKEHYGIHGTRAPESIGRAQSHGCIRLTNWDAARLAQMVSSGLKAVFQA